MYFYVLCCNRLYIGMGGQVSIVAHILHFSNHSYMYCTVIDHAMQVFSHALRSEMLLCDVAIQQKAESAKTDHMCSILCYVKCQLCDVVVLLHSCYTPYSRARCCWLQESS
jgi:hypothetical protein